ncbi:hypothetical protein ACVWYN_001328 [Pedobacter sp. UYP24]
MIIGKKRKNILSLNEIGLICLKASVYAQEKLSNKEGIMILYYVLVVID